MMIYVTSIRAFDTVNIEQKLIQETGFLIGAIIIAQNRQFVSALLFPEMEVIDRFKNNF